MKTGNNTIKTIADIAKTTGFSKSTVSRALNNSILISDETKKKIWEIADKYNFEMNQEARNLRLKKSNTITLIVPVSPDFKQPFERTFISEIMQGIIYAISEYEYDLLIGQPKKNNPNDMMRYTGLKKSDGLILPSCDLYIDKISDFINTDTAVIINGTTENPHYCSVDCDNESGGRLAAEHLLEIGCKKIVFIGGTKTSPEVSLRLKGFLNAIKTIGLKVDPSLIVYGNYTTRSGYENMQKLLEEFTGIDGVFICSDLMAIGAMEAIREKNLDVPRDINVIGFDDIKLAAHCSPPLTTIRQNTFKIGEVLIHNLMQYMKDKIITKAILPVELIKRKSTKNNPNKA